MDLNQTEVFDLEKQRTYLFQAEQAYKTMPQLKAKREMLERKIAEIHKQIEKKFYHSPLKSSPSSNLSLEELKQQLKALNQEIQSLDTFLDEWEELNEYQLHAMREKLFMNIWESLPGQYKEKKLQWESLKTALILNAEIKKIRAIVDQLSEILQTVMKTRSSIKGRGIFSYIFGISPNAIIERHLLFAHEIIINSQPDLKHALRQSRDTDLYTIFQTIFQVMDQLKDHCKKIWGFRHIDTTISKAEKEISELAAQLKNKDKTILNEIEELKNQLNEWIKNIPLV